MNTITDEQVVVIDCITLLVNAVFNEFGETMDEKLMEQAAVKEINEIIDCMQNIEADFYIVTNEVGLGLVPPYEAGRYYRDILGRANSMLAAFCDEVYFMVSGIPMKAKPSDR